MVMAQVCDVTRRWGWVSSMLVAHFTFKEETTIQFFGMIRGVMPIIDEELRRSMVE